MNRRQHLPNRRPHVSFTFEHEGLCYHASASRFASGQVAEIFLTTSKAGSAAQAHAEAAAILASICLQQGTPAGTIIRSVGGAIGKALELAEAPV